MNRLPRHRHNYTTLILLGVTAIRGAEARAQTPSASVVPPAPFERELTGAARPSLPGAAGYRVFESERTWVVTNDTVRAHEVIAALRWSAARFERIFGKPVPRGVAVPLCPRAGAVARLLSGESAR